MAADEGISAEVVAVDAAAAHVVDGTGRRHTLRHAAPNRVPSPYAGLRGRVRYDATGPLALWYFAADPAACAHPYARPGGPCPTCGA